MRQEANSPDQMSESLRVRFVHGLCRQRFMTGPAG